MTIDSFRIKSMAMVLGDEDWYLLWELLDTAVRHYPDEKRESLITACADALLQLMDLGLVKAGTAFWPRVPDEDDSTISISAVRNAISEYDSWSTDPKDDHLVWFAATESGRRAVQAGEYLDEGY